MTKKKQFTHGIIGTDSTVDIDILKLGLRALVPGAEDERTKIVSEPSFPTLYELHNPNHIRYHAAEAKKAQGDMHTVWLNNIKQNYRLLVNKNTCICLIQEETLNIAWLDALKRNGHGVLVYRTELAPNSVKRYRVGKYIFSSWENGRLMPRGIYSLLSRKWLRKVPLKPVNSWKLLPHIGMAA